MPLTNSFDPFNKHGQFCVDNAQKSVQSMEQQQLMFLCHALQEVILKGVHWDRVMWGMPLLVVLQRLRKLVLIDNHLTNLHQVRCRMPTSTTQTR